MSQLDQKEFQQLAEVLKQRSVVKTKLSLDMKNYKNYSMKVSKIPACTNRLFPKGHPVP
jgi:hypothetical protein